MSYRSNYADGSYGDYVFTCDKKRLDLDYLYKLLCIPSRYSTGLPPERLPLVVENSLCFAVFYQDKQVGFARVISDYSEFSSLWDLFIDDEHRAKGVGQALLRYIFDHPHLPTCFQACGKLGYCPPIELLPAFAETNLHTNDPQRL